MLLIEKLGFQQRWNTVKYKIRKKMQTHFLCVVIKIWVWTLWDLGIKAAVLGYILLTSVRCRNYRRSHKWKATRGFAEELWWACSTAGSSRGLVLAGPLPCAAEDLLSNLCSSSVHLPSCPLSPGTGIALEFFTRSQGLSATTEPFCHRRMEGAYLRFSSAGNWLILPKAFASFSP